MRVPVPLRLAAIALAAIVVACSSDSFLEPSTNQAMTLSQLLSEMNLPALSGVASALSPAPVASAAAPVPSTCSYSASSQSFICPTVVTVNGLTVTQSYTLLDASGQPQSQFDPGTTAAVRTTRSSAGTLTLTGSTSIGSLTIDQQQDMVLSGLLTSTHVLNGMTAMHISGAISTGTTTTPTNATLTTATANLVLPPMNADVVAWPTSGSITEDVTTVDAGFPAMSTHLTMTFSGTSQVALVVTIGTTTQRCTIDLAKTSWLACT